jgi:hypothetical protein
VDSKTSSRARLVLLSKPNKHEPCAIATVTGDDGRIAQGDQCMKNYLYHGTSNFEALHCAIMRTRSIESIAIKKRICSKLEKLRRLFEESSTAYCETRFSHSDVGFGLNTLRVVVLGVEYSVRSLWGLDWCVRHAITNHRVVAGIGDVAMRAAFVRTGPYPDSLATFKVMGEYGLVVGDNGNFVGRRHWAAPRFFSRSAAQQALLSDCREFWGFASISPIGIAQIQAGIDAATQLPAAVSEKDGEERRKFQASADGTHKLESRWLQVQI